MRSAIAALGLALLLSGCTGESGDATDTESPSPTPGPTQAAPEPERPKEGACYRLTFDDATRPTNDDEPVRCSTRHTARTIYVGRLSGLFDGRTPPVDSERVQRRIADRCPAQLARFVGGDAQARTLSRLQVVWFSPTLEEFEAGADWFRCDLIAFGAGGRLLRLPADIRLRRVLDRPIGLATFGLCGTTRPGARGFDRVACRLEHSWVAISTIGIPGGNRYPGAAAVREAGEGVCADEVRSRSGSPLEFSYGWEWPTRRQWAAGQRYGICWAPADR